MPTPVYPSAVTMKFAPYVTPRDLSGLTAWYEASFFDNLLDGALIPEWLDKSGNARTMPIDGVAPAWKKDIINGKPVVRFTGTQALKSSGFNIGNLLGTNGVGTVVAVVKANAANTGPIFEQDIASGSGLTPGATLVARNNDGTADDATISSDYRDSFLVFIWMHGSGYVYSGVISGTRSFDTAQLVSTASGTTASLTADVRIGRSQAGVYLNGDIAELAFFNRELTETERQKLGRSLCLKYSSTYTGTVPWIALTDVVITDPIEVFRGNDGTSMGDRVATTGTMTFKLDNSATNSQGKLGLYSPNNANCLAGWAEGAEIRCLVTYNGVEYSVFVGTVSTITPESGMYRNRRVDVACVDWMEEAAKAKIRGLSILLDKRSDEIFTEIIEVVERQPTGGILAQPGGDSYPYALDNALEGKDSVMTTFQALAQSELGRVYVDHNGRAVFESRHKRPNAALQLTLTDADIDELQLGAGREGIINHAEVQVHPRRVDAAATSVLFSLANKPSINRAVSTDIDILFRDPDARATRVGGMNMVQPVATTDYTFNSAEDGTGTDLTAQLSISVEYSANGGKATVTNNSPQDGFLTKFQCRGKGIYDYETVLAKADSQASKDLYGESGSSLDMPLQDDITVAKDAADYIVAQRKAIMTQVTGVTFIPNREDRLMLAALERDISDKVRVEETVTGNEPFLPVGEEYQEVSAKDFFINSIRLQIGENGVMVATWALEPADPFSYWVLDRTGATELSETTRLAYGAFIAGWSLDYSSLNVDTRVNQ